ncbi:MAG: GGDEF domain-containing protein [Blastocatellales bacterium]
MAATITQILHQDLERLLSVSGAALYDKNKTALDKEVEAIFRDSAAIRLAVNNAIRRYVERLSKDELIEIQSGLCSKLDELLLVKISELVEQRAVILAEQAECDPVTSLPNRAAFNRKLHGEIERARRYRREMSVVLFDVDRFKLVNDQFGHQAGDQMLARVAGILKSSLRQSDTIFRYGGDEFAAICPETSSGGMAYALQRLESNIPAWRIESYLSVELDISWGVASFPADSTEENDLIGIADERLYACKRARGRGDAAGR